MKYLKSVFFFSFAFLTCMTHSLDKEYLFIGQKEIEGSVQTAFVLKLLGQDLEQYVKITEEGEVYLRADKILFVPSEALSPQAGNLTNQTTMVTNNPSEYTLNECPLGHPSRHGDGRCNQPSCPYFRG